MRSASAALNLVLAVSVATPSSAFMPARNVVSSPPSVLHTSNDGREKQWTVDETTEDSEALPMGMDKFNIPNPLVELGNMFSNFDDVIDDFFFKRMGNGEVFYGKRKYKPSGKISTDYDGGGLSDWRKIEAAREFREERARMKEDANKE